jgi:hypothetical protein
MTPWIDMARVAITPTLDAEERAVRAGENSGVDDDEGSRPKRQRARPHLGERVTAATIYGRARRAKLKAARESGSV